MATAETLDNPRIVLIGGYDEECQAGKAETANAILGQERFPAGKRIAQSVRADAEICGKHVVVVNTPGWWWHFTRKDFPEHDQVELVCSVDLCPPGPHAFLLVVPVDMCFIDVHKAALEENLHPFGETFWRHTVVLFSSCGPHDGDKFEKHLRRWPYLRWLLKKCGNRHHVLDIRSGDSAQAAILLDKIADVVEFNNGRYYEGAENVAVGLEAWRQKIRKRVGRRRTVVEGRRMAHRALLQEMRIVLLGAQWAARSSSGNTILGRDAFEVNSDCLNRTARCVAEKGEVGGTFVTIVDTPGWFYSNPVQKTANSDKLQIKRSVSLCPPGPHVLLLTVPLATAYNELYHKAVKEHVALLGEDVWRFVIVLFTRGDWIGDTTVEEWIESEGKNLRWLVNKCDNRYHVFDNKNRADNVQVRELLKKIEGLVAVNGGDCYERDRDEDIRLKEQELSIVEEAQKMRITVQRIRTTLKELFKGETHRPSEERLVVLGQRGVGKSSACNTIMMKSDITKPIKLHTTTKCVLQKTNVLGKELTIVDTPGWTSLQDSPASMREEMIQSVSMCSPGPHVFLLVVPADSPFLECEKRNVYEHMGLFGERVWRHTVILFTNGDWLGRRPVEEHIVSEGAALQELVERCGNRYHVLRNSTWGDGSQVKTLLEKIDEVIVRNRGDHFSLEGDTFSEKETLSEEQWRKREEELIDRMLKAVVVNPEPEMESFVRKVGSIDILNVPNMSEETTSELGSSIRSGYEKVKWWFREHYPASSGIGSVSGAESDTDCSVEDHKLDIIEEESPTTM